MEKTSDAKNAERYERIHLFYPYVNRLSKEKLQKILDEGFVIKNGKYTEEEDKRIKKNFRRFLRKNGLKGDEQLRHLLLGYYQKSRDPQLRNKREFIKKLITEKNFYLELGRGLSDRTLYSVYQRARKISSTLRLAKELTADEREQILRLCKKKGREWSEIAEIVDCNPKTANEIADSGIDGRGNRWLKAPFTKEEDLLLIKGIMQELNIDNIWDANKFQIPWMKVKDHLQLRSPDQCRNHWIVLREKISSYVEPDLLNIVPYSDLDSAKLIYIFYKKRHEWFTFETVDWDLLKARFEHVGSLYEITRWWLRLSQEVPDNESKPIPKIAKWLYKHRFKVIAEQDKDEVKQFYALNFF